VVGATLIATFMVIVMNKDDYIKSITQCEWEGFLCALRAVKNGNICLHLAGICFNVHRITCITNGYRFSSYKLVMKLAKGWPEHSGSDILPVPSTISYGSHDHWEDGTEEAAARYRLLDYLIKESARHLKNIKLRNARKAKNVNS